jgi:DNA polymerase-3 subunit alpha
VRERQSLGFYVSGHPLERYVKGDAGLAKLGAARRRVRGMDDWAVVKLAGMVEGYRERIFKDGGGKVAFFELEDLTGRVSVKVRAREIESTRTCSAKGEPVLVTGKVSFPQRDEDDAEDDEDGPREPTILLNEVPTPGEAVRADTRSIAIRVRAERTRPPISRAWRA